MEHIMHIWPTVADLAADLGRPYQTVASWKVRGHIPAEYDVELVELAARRGHALRFEDLARARMARKVGAVGNSAPDPGVAAE